MPLLLVATFVALWSLLTWHRRPLGLTRLSVRGTLVVTQIAFQALVVSITELLSVRHHLTRSYALGAWLVAFTLLVMALSATAAWRPSVPTAVADTFARLRSWLSNIGYEAAIALSALVALLCVLATIGWLYPPSNGDSMVYHLPRVAHWIQDRSVEHFATHYLAQIELAPLHEFNMLHLHLLSGGDRLDGYPQLLAFIICIAGASEVARLLGADRRTQLTAAVVCAVIPSAILEATSTQNNLFAGSVGVGILVLLLAWQSSGPWVGRAIFLGLAGGEAILSKGTLPALLAPAILLLGAWIIDHELRASSPAHALRRVAGAAAIIFLTAALVSMPFLRRNFELFHSPIGPVSRSTTMPERSLRPAAANIIRSVAVDFRIGDGQHDPATLVSHAVLGGLRHIYDRTGILADDQRYVMGTDTDAFRMADYRSPERLEDFGANPWHVILLTMSGGYIIYRVLRGDRHLRLPALLAIGLALGFALFSATARWSVFVPRYQVPLLVAWSPLIAIALASLPRLAGRVVVALLLIACLPQLLDNQTRSLLHPTYHFPSDIARYFQFFGIPDARVHDYEMVRDVIANSTCDRVGIGNWILVEYPIWAGLEHVGWRGTIEHVGVQNESAKLEDKDFLPCAVLKEVPPDYIAEDTGRVHLRFGQLALSIDADRLSTATISGLVGDGAREP